MAYDFDSLISCLIVERVVPFCGREVRLDGCIGLLSYPLRRNIEELDGVDGREQLGSGKY